MRRSVKILVLIAAAVLCLPACTGGGKIIPRKKMVRIYTDMLLSDQWITAHPEANMMADTTMVYEPVFNKYGYTTEDYKASVEHYLEDPIKFSRMIKEVALSFENRAKTLRGAQGEPQPQELETNEPDE